MATKKCPKCGEENPAEAVMCWACYTPLAGGAVAAAAGGLVAPRGGAAAVTPAASAASEEKKAIDPKIFLVVGLLVAAGVIGAFTTGIFSSSEEEPPDDSTNSVTNSVVVNPPPPPPGPAINVVVDANNSGPAQSAVPVVEQHYRVMVAPDPRSKIGTMGIVAIKPNVSVVEAGGLAKFARNQFAPNGKWSRWQIVVFNNRDAARTFQKYQAQRRNAYLSAADYQQLASSGLWSSVPAYYESEGKNESFYQPSKSPNNWWTAGKP